MIRSLRGLAACVLLPVTARAATAAPGLPFVGNGFTCGAGSAVPDDRATTVSDLNHDGIGGAPAFVKSVLQQAGLDHAVYGETRGGSGRDFHVQHMAATIGRRGWDRVVMHGDGPLDAGAVRCAAAGR